MPEADLRELTVPPELSPLEAQLAQQAVIDEMAIPGGLRFDEPVTDPLSQFKADVREVLATYPPTLDTQLAAQYITDAKFVVPAAETAEPEPPPEPIPPELLELQPAEASNQVPRIGVRFIGGPFTEFAEVVIDDVAQATTLSTESEVTAYIDCLDPEAASTRDCFVRQGEDETAHLPFSFTAEPVRESVREKQERDAGDVTFARSGPHERS